MENMEFKPNSFKYREEQKKSSEETKPVVEIQKVVQGPVSVKKKSGAKRLFNMLLAEDFPKVKEYILQDVLIPSIKKALDDIISNGSHMLIFGESARNKSNSFIGTKVSFKDYTSYSKSSNTQSTYKTERTGFDYEDMIFDFRGDAEEVLAQMKDLLAKYGIVRVSYLYELIGKKNDNYCVYNYGWTNLDSARVVRMSNGYSLQLPKPYTID